MYEVRPDRGGKFGRVGDGTRRRWFLRTTSQHGNGGPLFRRPSTVRRAVFDSDTRVSLPSLSVDGWTV